MTIIFKVRDRSGEDYSPRKEAKWVPVTRKGTYFDIKGHTVELFRVKTLADALDRTVAVLRKWEREGFVPKPIYTIPGDQCKHWYSAAQIINCHRLMMGRYGGKKYLQDKATFTQFLADVTAVWQARDVVVDVGGQLPKEK